MYQNTCKNKTTIVKASTMRLKPIKTVSIIKLTLTKSKTRDYKLHLTKERPVKPTYKNMQ